VPTLGFIYFFLVFVFFIQYCHPYYTRWLAGGIPVVGGTSYIQAAALAGSVLRTIIFCSLLFSTIKFFKFPVGSLFAVLFSEALGIGLMGGQFQYIFSAIAAGVLTELVYHILYARLDEPIILRVFGLLLPMVFFLPYIFITLLYNPTWWSVHMIVGEVIINAIAGLLLTYLIMPPLPHSNPA
jgi:hypothetical protein